MIRHCGEHDDWNVGRRAQPTTHAESILSPQHQVKEDEVDRVPLKGSEHCSTVSRNGHRMGMLAKELRQQRQDVFVVIDYQQMRHSGHSLASLFSHETRNPETTNRNWRTDVRTALICFNSYTLSLLVQSTNINLYPASLRQGARVSRPRSDQRTSVVLLHRMCDPTGHAPQRCDRQLLTLQSQLTADKDGRKN